MGMITAWASAFIPNCPDLSPPADLLIAVQRLIVHMQITSLIFIAMINVSRVKTVITTGYPSRRGREHCDVTALIRRSEIITRVSIVGQPKLISPNVGQ